ncbi:MAG: Flp family type IVb pilin [Methylophilaceae bacterium]
MLKFANIKKQAGQGMTEYIIIVALIAVAAIGVYSYFGNTVRNQTAAMANELAGKDASAQQTKAKDSATKADDRSGKATLGTYGNQQNN